RDRAAAGTDRVDVDHRHVQRPAADATLDGYLGLATADEADVGAGATDVDRDEVGEPGRLADAPRADHTRRRARQRGVDGLRLHDVGTDDATVRLHDRQRRRHAP